MNNLAYNKSIFYYTLYSIVTYTMYTTCIAAGM